MEFDLQFIFSGGLVKHIQNKDDWYYEFRPFFLVAIGLVGILSKFFIGSSGWGKMAVACGLVLIGIAFQIAKWRKEYRKSSYLR